MTTLVIAGRGLDMNDFDLSWLNVGLELWGGLDRWTLNSYGQLNTFTGVDFRFDSQATLSSGARQLAGGVVTGWIQSDLTGAVFEASGFSLPGETLSRFALAYPDYGFNLIAFAGDDQIVGGPGADTLRGEAGSDSIWAGAGADELQGNQGNDSLSGGEGSDTLRGGQGNDLVNGGLGDDRIYGDLGADTLTGGGGADVFVVSLNAYTAPFDGPPDVITDFNPLEDDRIRIEGDVIWRTEHSGVDTRLIINYGPDETFATVVVLNNISLAVADGWLALD